MPPAEGNSQGQDQGSQATTAPNPHVVQLPGAGQQAAAHLHGTHQGQVVGGVVTPVNMHQAPVASPVPMTTVGGAQKQEAGQQQQAAPAAGSEPVIPLSHITAIAAMMQGKPKEAPPAEATQEPKTQAQEIAQLKSQLAAMTEAQKQKDRQIFLSQARAEIQPLLENINGMSLPKSVQPYVVGEVLSETHEGQPAIQRGQDGKWYVRRNVTEYGHTYAKDVPIEQVIAERAQAFKDIMQSQPAQIRRGIVAQGGHRMQSPGVQMGGVSYQDALANPQLMTQMDPGTARQMVAAHLQKTWGMTGFDV